MAVTGLHPFKYFMEQQLIPFGKYKGQPIQVLAQDPQYLEWLQAQSWFKERYGSINTLIINNFTEPSETPEHNKIQALFTKKEFCTIVAKNVFSRIILNQERIYLKKFRNKDSSYTLRCSELKNHSIRVVSPIFEHAGIDVSLLCRVELDDTGYDYCIDIELKPTVSDDYPAILRQMNASNSDVLLIGGYTGVGATIKEVKIMFALSGKMIILIDELN